MKKPWRHINAIEACLRGCFPFCYFGRTYGRGSLTGLAALFLASVQAMAQCDSNGSGSGTAGDPFIVCDAKTLKKVGSGVGGWELGG
ncbi:MAG: hypothetical protein LBB36_02295, partial [Fibromonadaceae bacterium]|nr:hypothetical protein [Fibromonadaceae bacterium]